MLTNNKRKGVLLIILGITWVTFIYNFDKLMDRPEVFGTKAIICFIIGIICIVNGIRIYQRDVKK